MNWTAAAERVGLIAVVVSLLYVGYEMKRNNDLAVVESQGDLLGLSLEMKSWLVDKEIRQIIFSDDIAQLPIEDQQTFFYMAGAWFDLYEFVFLSYERGVLSDEQLQVWKAGMCTLPPSFFDAFGEQIPEEIFLKSLGLAVKECKSAAKAK